MKKYGVLGLMSGTSLDGLDMAYVEFVDGKTWKYEIICCSSQAYDHNIKEKLKYAGKSNALDLKLLDIEYGKWVGNAVHQFITTNKITPGLIASHGHTIFHQPDKGLTLQIGDGYQIMNATGITTICDLRSLDVSMGGQGAPLVPIGDKYLFGAYDVCLNLGGFSNVSFNKTGERIAYDICPVNTVLNYLSSEINLEFDKDGMVARSGKRNDQLLEKLNNLKYYRQKPPKSLGIEWVEQNVFPLLSGDSTENLLNTYCHHIAQQIVASVLRCRDFGLSGHTLSMLATGGGAKNSYLVELINEEALGTIDIVVPDKQLIDFKEAVIFAFLGLLRRLGKINTLCSATGAPRDSSGGLVFDHFETME
ncbi:MAG: anhydro-N-acetylmuramic acid kinase [Cytophagales bacterium]|nr:anhydro-N-acetylmuramic acid kinase [Cytophagales bacterium]